MFGGDEGPEGLIVVLPPASDQPLWSPGRKLEETMEAIDPLAYAGYLTEERVRCSSHCINVSSTVAKCCHWG